MEFSVTHRFLRLFEAKMPRYRLTATESFSKVTLGSTKIVINEHINKTTRFSAKNALRIAGKSLRKPQPDPHRVRELQVEIFQWSGNAFICELIRAIAFQKGTLR